MGVAGYIDSSGNIKKVVNSNISTDSGNQIVKGNDGGLFVAKNVTDTYSATSTSAMSGKAVASAISTKQDKITSSNKLAYSLISGTPTIPTVTDTYSATSSNAMSGKAVASAVSTKADKTLLNNVMGTSDAWSNIQIYEDGDYTIYDNKLWVCTYSNTGQTPTSGSTYWKQISIAELNKSIPKMTLNGTTLTISI